MGTTPGVMGSRHCARQRTLFASPACRSRQRGRTNHVTWLKRRTVQAGGVMRGINDQARAAVFAVTISLLAACGGGHGSGPGSASSASSSGTPSPAGGVHLQIVAFGDSLSDGGTYEPIANAVRGGRFTTNPGQVWTQNVAQYYGDTLSAAYTIDITH